MFPHIQIFLKQTRRSTKRLMLQLVLLCAAVAFFVVSLNLYQNSTSNLLSVENTYTTIATMDFRGYVNANGEIVSPDDPSCVGQHWLSLEDYDFSQLLALDSVEGIELRTRVGACIPGHIACYNVIDDYSVIDMMPDDWMQLMGNHNVIRFVLEAEEPLVIPLSETAFTQARVQMRILEMSNKLLNYPDKYSFRIPSIERLREWGVLDDIRRLNGNDSIDSIILYPDVEYTLAGFGGIIWTRDEKTGEFTWVTDNSLVASGSDHPDAIQFLLTNRNMFGEYEIEYYKHLLYSTGGYGEREVPGEVPDPFPLQRSEYVEGDPLWEDYIKCYEYSANSFSVTLTNNHRLIPAWNQGGMYLVEGRAITTEEYASGAKVCMVSAEMADYQGWQVGDTLDMHLYASGGFRDDTCLDTGVKHTRRNVVYEPEYHRNCGGFFEEDTYTIVGIYNVSTFTNFDNKIAPQVFFAPYNVIYIPANAAPDAPKGPIQPSLLTIVLKNGRHLEFEKAVEEMGLTEQKSGQYQITIATFDQGYGKIAGGLQEMNRNAKILLGLSSVLMLVTMILMAFLFSRQHKHSAGILRMLGGSKGQAFIAIFTCAAAVVATGGVVGAILGGVLTQSVGASILGDTAASAKVALSTGASPVLTAVSGVGCMVLFLLLTAIFTGMYIGKEPRALLPEDKN